MEHHVLRQDAGKIGEEHTEGDREQQQRLKLLDDRQIHENKGDQHHDELLGIVHQSVQTAGLPQAAQNIQ